MWCTNVPRLLYKFRGQIQYYLDVKGSKQSQPHGGKTQHQQPNNIIMVTSDKEVTSDEDEDPPQQEPTPVETIIPYKKQTSMTSYFAVPVPSKKKRGRGRPKKVAAVCQVEHQEEAPLAPPAKKQRLKVDWSSAYNWPALCEALET
jgi:hypothetical protein